MQQLLIALLSHKVIKTMIKNEVDKMVNGKKNMRRITDAAYHGL